MDFHGKTIWITGASSGIGEALAIAFSNYKVQLILSGRNTKELNRVKVLCEKNAGTCTIAAFDLSQENEITAAANTVLSKFPAIDILINNGGISQRSLAMETTMAVDRKVFETNFFGSVALSKRVLPGMVKNGGGKIVVISSVVGKFGFPLRTAYSASKHALQGYFDSLRAEMIKENIKVLMVSPGRIRTNISINAVNKNGEKYGVMDPGQARGISAEQCANEILSAIIKDKKDILIANKEKVMVLLRRFLPSMYYKLAAKVSVT